MSLKGFKVPSLTVKDIRDIANGLRKTLRGQNFKDIGQFLEVLIFKEVLEVVPDRSEELPDKVEAAYDPISKRILLKESDYRSLIERTNPRSKFTFWHEFGHFFLNHRRVIGRSTTTNHSYLEDSEWQANTFAAEITMPLDVIKKENLWTTEQIATRFRVSTSAARIRLKALKDEGL